MGSHHPTEAREPFMVRLAPSERELLERGVAAHRRTFKTCTSLSEWVRLVACEAAHRALRAASPATPADPRQVDLEELLGTRKPVPAGAGVEVFEQFVATRDAGDEPAADAPPAAPLERGRRRPRGAARRAGPRRAARAARAPRRS